MVRLPKGSQVLPLMGFTFFSLFGLLGSTGSNMTDVCS